MKANAHKYGRKIQTVFRRKESGSGNTYTQQGQREHCEGLFSQRQQHENRSKRQEPRDLAQTLQNTYFYTGECGTLHYKIIQQR